MRIYLNERPNRRIIRRFAVLPVKIERTVIWLEWYYVQQHKCHPRAGDFYIDDGYFTKEEYERISNEKSIE